MHVVHTPVGLSMDVHGSEETQTDTQVVVLLWIRFSAGLGRRVSIPRHQRIPFPRPPQVPSSAGVQVPRNKQHQVQGHTIHEGQTMPRPPTYLRSRLAWLSHLIH